MMTNDMMNSYLLRLGITNRQPPTLSFLFELQKAHVEFISWQTVDIVAKKPMPITLHSSIQLMASGRSGYCFHLNGAFGELLRWLGYEVSWHRAGVQPLGQEPRINSFHLGLSVRLKNEQQQEERWIVDVGLGDMPYEPLPLLSGAYQQGPFQYQVAPSFIDPLGWRLEHDPLGSSAGVDYGFETIHQLDVFQSNHEFYSSSPESPWIDLFLVRHRHAAGSNELRGCNWSTRDHDGIRKIELQSKSQWLEVLGDVFHEKLVNYDSHQRDELWKRVWQLHEVWKRRKEASDTHL